MEQGNRLNGGKRIKLDQVKYDSIIRYHLDGTTPTFSGANAAVNLFRWRQLANRFTFKKNQGGGKNIEFNFHFILQFPIK